LVTRKGEILKPDITPLRGGCNTALEPEQLPLGMFSMVQNMRPRHPGFEQRFGPRKLHTTADGTNSVLSVFHFVKGKKTERHFYAQMSDNDVLEATNQPPTVTTGVFGSEVFSGSASSRAASWGVIDDTLLFSNQVDQHQIYHGEASVEKFVVFKGTAAPPIVPVEGEDYSTQVSDGLTTTSAVLDSLGDLANDYDCIFIMTPVACKQFTVTVSLANGTASVVALKYWNGEWTAVSGFSDGTTSGGATLAQSGDMTWTQPTDAVPHYMYGKNGFWWQLYLSSGDLDSEVEITSVTFEADWQGIINKWDGYMPDAIEAQFYDASASVYNTYGGGAIEISQMTASDRVYFATYDPIVGFYVDVGATPNTTASTTINDLKFWNGVSWGSVTNLQDDTNGISQSGFVTFKRQPTVQQLQFQKTQYYLHWYYFTVDKTLSDDLSISIMTMPYFDITNWGTRGICNHPWKKRMVYSFDKAPNQSDKAPSWVYITASVDPQVLNGPEYSLLQAGDGRANKVVSIRKFYNDLIIHQEEKGADGGCISILQGYKADNYGMFLVSGVTGAFSSQCVDVVEGLPVSEGVTGTLAFSIGNKGIFQTPGKGAENISGDISNYFDPKKAECIRRGYEHLHWLKYDSTDRVVKVGLVSGVSVQTSTATSTTANKLVDTEGAFTTRKTVSGHPISHTIAIGDTVYNTTDSTSALITAIDSGTVLSLDTDIMESGEAYEIYSATCNLFPVYDPVDGAWSFDVFQQNISCLAEVEATSGNIASIVVAGGVGDGTIYQANYGNNDVSTAIDAYVDIELNAMGREMKLDEVLVTMKTGSALTITPYVDRVAQTATTETTISSVKNKYDMNYRSTDMTVRLQNNTAGEDFYLFGAGFKLFSNETR
jgi:hypothetical protein